MGVSLDELLLEDLESDEQQQGYEQDLAGPYHRGYVVVDGVDSRIVGRIVVEYGLRTEQLTVEYHRDDGDHTEDTEYYEDNTILPLLVGELFLFFLYFFCHFINSYHFYQLLFFRLEIHRF